MVLGMKISYSLKSIRKDRMLIYWWSLRVMNLQRKCIGWAFGGHLVGIWWTFGGHLVGKGLHKNMQIVLVEGNVIPVFIPFVCSA